ncbi:MAG: DUF3850 domain-containing protein [Cyanobacteria bacterium J06634_6]
MIEITKHSLKTHSEFFWPAVRGEKPFEIRKNDRGFQVGDDLELLEYDIGTDSYSGLSGLFTVTYVTDFAQQPGYVVMGIKPAFGRAPAKSLSDVVARGGLGLDGKVKITEG